MRRQDIEDAINLLIRFRDASDNGSVEAVMLESVDNMIHLLDAEIEAMDEIRKSESDWNLIGMAYQFYRIRAKQY